MLDSRVVDSHLVDHFFGVIDLGLKLLVVLDAIVDELISRVKLAFEFIELLLEDSTLLLKE